MKWPVRLSIRVYRLLLGAFPRRFRDRFGPEVAATFEQLAAETWRRSRWKGLLRLWLRTCGDLSRHGGGERLGVGLDVTRARRTGSAGSGARVLDSLVQDTVFAARTLRHAPMFAAAVIGTIALGIGANTAIFTVVNGALLRPRPFDESERVVILCETHEQVGDYCVASPPNVEDWARASATIESFALARGWSDLPQVLRPLRNS